MTVKKKTTKKKVVKKKATKKKSATKKISPKEKAEAIKKRVANNPDKYVFGRPTKYEPEYAEMIYEACKSGECLTIASICVKLEICRDTYYDWLKKYADFSDAIKKGTEFRKMYMEQKGLNGMNAGKNFNAVPWLFLTKNMFPDEYQDKKEIAVGNTDKDEGFKFNFDLSKVPDHRK